MKKLMQKGNRQILAENDLDAEGLIAKGYTEAATECDTVQHPKCRKDNKKEEGAVNG